ncbi:MAG: acireductone synthase [Fimbriimonadaceae bacterium]|nr:acireductone synthase [Fimbriimonadaceae bacterium]
MRTYKAYLLDIEGTTTPIDFVTRTLFPYARRSLRDFVDRVDTALIEDADLLSHEYERDISDAPDWPNRPDPREMAPYLEWLMDHDRKSTGLKSIQGRIWEQGYRNGELQGEIYPDVEPAMRRWHGVGASIAIFSSGSVLAQRLLFSHLPNGDLTPLITDYFDTTTGPKREASSYETIADRMSVEPSETLFLSDIIQEVEAARQAGMDALLVVRKGEAPAGSIREFSGL